MNTQIKKEWIKRLRSGDFKQGRGCLRTHNNEYCCLGVLVNILDPDGWKVHEDNTYSHSDRIGGIPTPIMSKCEITVDQEWNLIEKNDQEGWSFDRIADWIEANL